MILFEEKVKDNKDAFLKRIFEIADYLKVPVPDWLMFAINFETAGTFNPQIVNFQRGDNPDPFQRCKYRATGLIQFMPATAISLGTTNEKLMQMTNVQQLEYVQKYLKTWKGKYKSFIDLYLAIFYPAAIGKPDTFTITSDVVARQNRIFDINSDLDITKAEIKEVMKKHVPERYKHLFV